MKTLNVPDMSCGHCKSAIEKALEDLDPSSTVKVDLEARTVSVDGGASDAAILGALKAAGYTATVA